MIVQSNPDIMGDAITSIPRRITKAQFAFTNWATLKVGDSVDGLGVIGSPLERALVLEIVPQILADCFIEVSAMDDEPQERLKKMMSLSKRK
jgi:hypothetical protein